MNVSSAKRNIPKDIKSLKSKFFFISITSILCRIEVNHPVSRLPVAGATNNIISQYIPEHKFEKLFPMQDTKTVLPVDSWENQETIDIHHHTPMMSKIVELREKYDLHMTVERYILVELPKKDREYIKDWDNKKVKILC